MLVPAADAMEEAVPVGPFPSALLEWPFDEETVVQNFSFFPIRQAGRLSACGLEFTLWARDWAYRRNQPMMVTGSINYVLHSAISSSVVLKLHVADYENRDGTAWVKPGDVHFAYIDIDQLSLAASTSEFSSHGEPGSVFRVPDSDTSLLFALMNAETLDVWFNRQDGGADLQLRIDAAKHPSVQRGFYSCALELLGVALRELESQLTEEADGRSQ